MYPHPYIYPLVVIANECLKPQTIFLIYNLLPSLSNGKSTFTGFLCLDSKNGAVVYLSFYPTPHCPKESSPIAYISPY